MAQPPIQEERAEIIERFCHEYVRDFKGGAAARRAGISNPAYSRSWASRMLARPEVAARVAELKAAALQRADMDVADMIDRLARIAKVDVRELVELRRSCCRHCWGKDFLWQYTDGGLRMARYKHEQEVKKAQREGRDLIDEVPEFDEKGGGGFDSKRDPNEACPECEGEGVMTPFLKDTRELGADAAAMFAGLKVTKDGVEVKTHDAVKAIELLGRFKNAFTDHVNLRGEFTVKGFAGRMRSRSRAPGSDLV